jgi:hypothetical protein
MNKSHDINTNYILLRKNSEKENTNSIFVWELNERKIEINIKDDKQFLKKDKFQSNIMKIKNDIKSNLSDNALIRIDKTGMEENRILKKYHPNLDIESNEVVKNALSNENVNDPNTPQPVPVIRIVTPGSKGLPSILTEIDRRLNTLGSKDETNRINDLGVVTNQSESEINEFFKFCFLCDKLHLSNNMISLGCNHAFCIKCGKVYYEDKIEQGDKILKCPVFKCQKTPDKEFLSTLVTERHLTLLSKLQTQPNSSRDTKFEEVKVYTQKHILDINNNDNFLLYNKTKELFCQKCTEASLYGRTGKTYVKCLNCFNTICKFCMKVYNYDHLDITSESYCKVYFRKDLKKQVIKPNKCKLYLLTLGLIIASYFLLFISVLKYILKFFENKEKSKCKTFTNYILIILLYILMIPIMLMTIPYFPLLISMLK